MKEAFFNWLSGLGVEVTSLMALVIALGFIVITSLLLHMALHRVLLVRLVGILGKAKQVWLPPQLQQRLFNRLAFVLQGAVLLGQAEIWLPRQSDSLKLIEMVAQLWILLFLLLAFFALLDCLLSVSRYTRLGRDLPLRGIFQGAKLVGSILVGILMIALLLGKSPLFLFSGLGAMTAVLMLVFKDPILGLVAGIQLSANRML
ncbi:MAG: miniconductance mechanosensitive channel, partial [Aeromonas veronii]